MVVALGILFFSAGAAHAHGGAYQLAIASDGAGGVVVSASYTEDQHPVGGIIDPVATAVAADGRTVGPIALISSSEGEGLWVSVDPFIPVGDWNVTVVTTIPEPVTATVAISVAPLPAAPAAPTPSVSSGGAAAQAEDSGTASPAESASSSATPWLWIAAALVVLIVAAGAVLLNRKRIASALQAGRERERQPV
jgi:hypothetical protein